ncbi:MAG: YceD family protein [Acidocella sp.]|nr:YceD family protein [Acidocella sp.]
MRKVYNTWMQEELSYPVRAGQIKDQSLVFTVRTNESQRAALASRFALPAISRLEGRFALHHERSGVIAAALTMDAAVTQVCVVTLEPFEAIIKDTAALRFVPEAAIRYVLGGDEQEEAEEDVTPDTLDSPDEIPYANDSIDLGAALAEQLALALDPYPRKPGAVLSEAASDDSANPFAGLAARFAKPD